MTKTIKFLTIILLGGWLIACSSQESKKQSLVDYVNPYMGNISHLLVPTYPTVHLPNSMLRVYPERDDYTSDQINGLPLIVTSHRGRSAFRLSPVQTTEEKSLSLTQKFTYDNEFINPYGFEVLLDEKETFVKYAVSHQSGIYTIEFRRNEPTYILLNTDNGHNRVDGNKLYASQHLENGTQVFIYAETDITPQKVGLLQVGEGLNEENNEQKEGPSSIGMYFGDNTQTITFKYGISFISIEQAKKNLQREIPDFNQDEVENRGRDIWNQVLSKIEVDGCEQELQVFYTSLYRTFERPVNISEDGRYFSAFDGLVHDDGGVPFYTDDWIWDSYRAAHPLRLLIDSATHSNIINSFLRMTDQMPQPWMPTFPEITGDSRRMNSNHGVSVIADAYVKGLTSFDLEKAFDVCKKAIEEKTLAPWSSAPAGWIDDFYKKNGYIPALGLDEQEDIPEVHHFEKRQPIAVTLGTAYDEWCLAQIAKFLGHDDEKGKYLKHSLNYQNVYNENTHFFHPKDKHGKFIEPFDYRYSGGMGAREYYGENNAWIYRWDVQHNIANLVEMMGGKEKFDNNLDQMYREPLGKSKFDFYSKLPDHTGNVGQFSMANEPSLHIPYLYNYAGKPWKTQKRIHTLMDQWFRNDLMGVPGDEDGGGMSAFVVFSMLGFYPVTPGLPMYVIGSPFFETAAINLENGKVIKITTTNYGVNNKYIQSMTLNGEEWNKSWLSHSDIKDGAEIHFIMGSIANPSWASDKASIPPSFNINQ